MTELKIIDVHSHLLPDVDDGSRDFTDTLDMLKRAKREGITDIICTPHYRLDMFLTPACEDKRVFGEVKKLVENHGLNINLYLGQELHNATEMLSLVKKGKALTLNNGKYLLLEFSWHRECDFVGVISEYVKAGYVPIVVHFERFPYYSLSTIKKMKKAGALIQVNAFSLFSYESARSATYAFEMLDNDLVDFIASDIHYYKDYLMKDAYRLVEERYGKKRAEDLFYFNPLKVIENR